jgi:hypothetical protein
MLLEMGADPTTENAHGDTRARPARPEPYLACEAAVPRPRCSQLKGLKGLGRVARSAARRGERRGHGRARGGGGAGRRRRGARGPAGTQPPPCAFAWAARRRRRVRATRRERARGVQEECCMLLVQHARLVARSLTDRPNKYGNTVQRPRLPPRTWRPRA